VTESIGRTDRPFGVGRALSDTGLVLLAAFEVVGTIGAGHDEPQRRTVDALAIALVLLGPLSLFLVRRHTVAVLGVVLGSTALYMALNYPYGPVVFSVVIAVLVAVVRGHRLAAWVGLFAFVVAVFVARTTTRDESWSWALLAGAVAWSLLILVVGEIARFRRAQVQAARIAQEETARRQANEERLRIARELHDTVAHHMSLINVQAGVALHLLDKRPEQAQTALAAIKDASKEGLAELRSLVEVLRDEGRAPRSPTAMLDSLDELVERARVAGLGLDMVVEGSRRSIPTAVELAAYRVVQESITNVVRHSGANTARILLRYGDDELTVQVDDDGRGIALPRESTTNEPVASELAAGSGIRGMRERASALGGSFDLAPSDLGGTRVSATFPLTEVS